MWDVTITVLFPNYKGRREVGVAPQQMRGGQERADLPSKGGG
jgi:hypothetical protein